MSMNRSYLISVVPLFLTIVSGLILSSSVVVAKNDPGLEEPTNDNNVVVDKVNLYIPPSCTLSGVGMDSHTTTINNGTYVSDIGTTTVKAFCNDAAGFAIYAAGYTGDEVGGTNSTKLVGANNIGNISTGTGTTGNSQWAMKLATDSNATYPITIESDTNGSFASYHIVPEEYTKVASRASSTDTGTAAIGSVLTTTYQVYISQTQSAGTYAGKVIYTLVHPATHVAPVVCNSNATTISEVKCMQDFANVSSANKTAIIASMTPETQYTLKDKRDEKTYTIAKLADGNVWMTQNLDLDLDSSVTYTNLDTDLGWNGTSYSTAAWTPSRSTYATATNNIHQWCNGGTWNSQYGYCAINSTPESYDPGNLYWNEEISDFTDWDTYYNSCDYSANPPACDESLNPFSTYISSTGTAQYHLGNYYNWAAAIASNDASIYGVYNENTGGYENLEANQSICPAGWTLPYATRNNNTDQSEGDFVDLWSEYGWDSNDYAFSDITDLIGAPLYFSPAGIYLGNLGDVGSSGYFWSSVAGNDEGARSTDFNVDGYAGSAGNDGRSQGYSVRCLLRL